MSKLPLPRTSSLLLRSSFRPILSSPCPSTSSTSPTYTATNSKIIPNNHILHQTQIRHATLIPRPQRPYSFTQLIQLSDGSTYTVRTTSPQALHRSSKDTRNHIKWQPSEASLRNLEVDEAGKLAAFRERFGRGWDLEAAATAGTTGSEAAEAEAESAVETQGAASKKQKTTEKDGSSKKEEGAAEEGGEEDVYGSLGDLISGYASKQETKVANAPVARKGRNK